MKLNNPKQIFLEFFLIQDMIYTLEQTVPVIFKLSKNPEQSRIDSIIDSLNEKSKRINWDVKEFIDSCNEYVKAIINGEQPPELKYIRAYFEKIKKDIELIPNNLDKAENYLLGLIELEDFHDDQVYEAMVLLDGKISEHDVEKVVKKWKSESKKYNTKDNNLKAFPKSNIFWISRDFKEVIDSISRYKFKDHFDIADFDYVFAEVENLVASALLEGSGGIEASFQDIIGDHHLQSIAYNLWLTSRCFTITNKLRDFVNVALHRLEAWQYADGSWSNYQKFRDVGKDSKTGIPMRIPLPSIITTALSSLNLLKLSISETSIKSGLLGASWLLKQQNSNGSWSINLNNGENPDVFLTLIALETLVRSNIKGITKSINLGLKWVLDQQDVLGTWERSVLTTISVIELMELINSKTKASIHGSDYLLMSKAFLNRSSQLSLEKNLNSHRLAIITAFQGLEAFTYGILSQPSINISIFQSVNKTIGLREALKKFETYLRRSRRINTNTRISYCNSIDKLMYLRNEIVHKGITVSEGETKNLIKNTISFIRKYSKLILNYDLLKT